jgi:RimJ/RimL family protein N-acetyltransferase
MSKPTLRKVNKSDINLIYIMACDTSVRQNSINTNKIKWDDHKIWFRNKLNSKKTKIYIGELNKVPFGQIRFDHVDGFYLIDFSVISYERGKGLGKYLLFEGIKFIKKEDLNPKFRALVKFNNISSIKVFEKCGFIELNTKTINNNKFIIFENLNFL